MSSFRRNGISKTIMLRVYNEIARKGRASVLDLRRSLPDYSSTTINKAVNELSDIG